MKRQRLFKKQIKVLELRCVITEMENPLSGTAVNLNWQKNESVNLKRDQERLCNPKSTGKKEECKLKGSSKECKTP